MVVFVHEIARILLGVMLTLPMSAFHVWAQKPPAPDDQGFKTDPQLAEITALFEAKRFEEAKARATLVIHRPASSFKSAKHEQFIKASAHYFGGMAAARLGQDEVAMSEFRQAAEMGKSAAYFEVGGRLTAQAHQESSAEARNKLFYEALEYYKGCAELGDTDCMDIVQKTSQKLHREDEENYWSLLKHMNGSAAEMEVVSRFYDQGFSDAQRATMTRVMHERSLSGGEVNSAIKRLPGRSTVTSAFVDIIMRRQLEFVWRAFFSASGPDESLYQSFQQYGSHLPTNSFATAYLLVAQPVETKDDTIIPLNSVADLASNLLNGDELIVRCGPLTHSMVLWDIGSKKDVLLLDPFYEFWQPSHNACVKAMHLVAYRYKRDLVQVTFADLRNMLQGVITIRDSSSHTKAK